MIIKRKTVSKHFYFAGFLLILGVLIAYGYATRLFRLQMSEATKHKSAKEAQATVQSVTKLALGNTIEMGLDDAYGNPSARQQLYRVCFALDEFSEMPPEERSGYEKIERSRGQRCQNTSRVDLALRLKKGDKLKVMYLLENEKLLDIERVTAHGECIWGVCQ